MTFNDPHLLIVTALCNLLTLSIWLLTSWVYQSREDANSMITLQEVMTSVLSADILPCRLVAMFGKPHCKDLREPPANSQQENELSIQQARMNEILTTCT